MATAAEDNYNRAVLGGGPGAGELAIRDAYWLEGKLKKGPIGSRRVPFSQGEPFDEFMRRCCDAFGAPLTGVLSAPSPANGMAPRPMSTMAEVSAAAADANGREALACRDPAFDAELEAHIAGRRSSRSPIAGSFSMGAPSPTSVSAPLLKSPHKTVNIDGSMIPSSGDKGDGLVVPSGADGDGGAVGPLDGRVRRLERLLSILALICIVCILALSGIVAWICINGGPNGGKSSSSSSPSPSSPTSSVTPAASVSYPPPSTVSPTPAAASPTPSAATPAAAGAPPPVASGALPPPAVSAPPVMSPPPPAAAPVASTGTGPTISLVVPSFTMTMKLAIDLGAWQANPAYATSLIGDVAAVAAVGAQYVTITSTTAGSTVVAMAIQQDPAQYFTNSQNIQSAIFALRDVNTASSKFSSDTLFKSIANITGIVVTAITEGSQTVSVQAPAPPPPGGISPVGLTLSPTGSVLPTFYGNYSQVSKWITADTSRPYPISTLSNDGINYPMYFRSDDQYLGRGLLAGAIDGVQRQYFLACNLVQWDFGTGVTGVGVYTDLYRGGQIPPPFYPRDTTLLGYTRKMFIGFTDATFTTTTYQPPYQAGLGPTMHAEVGDTMQVVFFNNCTTDETVHPHGLHYVGTNAGAWTQFQQPGSAADVKPGQTATYNWVVAAKSGPVGAGNDMSSVGWTYHSHVQEEQDVAAGLIGLIVVTARGWAKPDGSPKDVDREFPLFMTVVNTNNKASGQMYTVNGKIFGQNPPYSMTNGDRVRWYCIGLGGQIDIHTVHWHKNTVVVRGYRTDIVDLLPGSMATADMVSDDTGLFLLHCHVGEHLAGGMLAGYYVGPRPGQGAKILENWSNALFPQGGYPMPGYVYPAIRNI